MSIYLRQIELGPLQNFVYLIGCLETHQAAVVDPGWDVPKILETAKQDEMRITQIIVTHTHFDHVNGVGELVAATDAQVLVHKKETGQLPVEPSNLKTVEGGSEIQVGKVTLSFLHTPGHTPGSQCITAGDCLVSGDTLFVGGCGRCDLPGGDPEELFKSLTRLSRLDDRMVVHPGHNYAASATSTLSQEKGYNPFLKAQSLDGFLNLVGAIRRG
ncbi:MAG: MBL fold metallo-hydrolase [Candidatus Omnitrophica bacterium]|nr:MBL fold metallo-hydrolase [Candidatus Omnitrophota bacterium]